MKADLIAMLEELQVSYRTVMEDAGCNPDEGWVMVMNLGHRSRFVNTPNYVQFSDLVPRTEVYFMKADDGRSA